MIFRNYVTTEKNKIQKLSLIHISFKIATDPYVGRLTFFRVYSGKIEAGSYIYNSRSGKKERVSRLFQMHSNKQNPVCLLYTSRCV